jgi:hypothetical protein
MDGGSIDATGATLQIGSQAANDSSGLILNGGTISGGTLQFGAAEAVVYASTSGLGTTIASLLSGTGGLTLCGPGGLVLENVNLGANLLWGPVTVNSGTLTAANNCATGSGAITVNPGATLAVTGSVVGPVTVGQSGTLLLDGGEVLGDVTLVPVGRTNSLPGGVLEGSGTLYGTVTAAGIIQSGVEPGILNFIGTVDLPGDGSFYWRPQGLVDNEHSCPGVGWNALKVNQKKIWIGGASDIENWWIYADFSVLGGDPDAGDDFWKTAHKWTLITFPNTGWNGHWGPVTQYYAAGWFDTDWDKIDPRHLYLTWTPHQVTLTPAELCMARAKALVNRARRSKV